LDKAPLEVARRSRRIQPQKWITHRFRIEQAAEAYGLLDENSKETIQVLFEYNP
jgi:threonine dehydrogenase-like Zn-dependent dehydrogenase